MCLWQAERLVGFTMLVNIAEVGFAIQTIVTFRGKHEPAAIAAPRVISIALGTIRDAKCINLTRLQVHHLQIGLWMPDGEGAVVGYGIKNVLTVGADTWMAYTTLLVKCIYLSADGARFLVKGDAYQTILQLFDVLRQTHTIGRTVVDVLAIGREGRECLELQTVGKQW